MIHLTTFVKAPIDRVFDLSRNVSVHKQSMKERKEEIVGGKFSGIMEKGEDVTWKAKHLFKWRILKVKMTEVKKPEYFSDEQVQGDFKLMKHEHYFRTVENGTIMIDQFNYESPKGWIGKLVDRLFLQKYMTGLLCDRNEYIRQIAEGQQWKQFV